VTEPQRVLVLGAAGQIGRATAAAARSRGWWVRGATRHDCDVTRPDQVEDTVAGGNYTAVVNLAAYTAVDKAEHETDHVYAVNRDGAVHVATACAIARVPLIHVSTDYVFDGAKEGPYTEDDPVRPLNVYGMSKAAGEDAVRLACRTHVILRTSWVYSAHGGNFLNTMLAQGREHSELAVVDDQVGCPTYAADVAQAIAVIIQSFKPNATEAGHTLHFCGAGATTWYGFAEAIFAEAARYGVAHPCLRRIVAADRPTPARRPRNSALDCSRVEQLYGIRPRPWRQGLRDCLAQIFEHQPNTESAA
jgi:dTDP-4-dehydrorhamnose reductase